MAKTEISLDGSHFSIQVTAENVPGGCGARGWGEGEAGLGWTFTWDKVSDMKKFGKPIKRPAVAIPVFLSNRQPCMIMKIKPHGTWYLGSGSRPSSEAGCSQEEGPRKGFVMGSRTQGVQEILEKCI